MIGCIGTDIIQVGTHTGDNHSLAKYPFSFVKTMLVNIGQTTGGRKMFLATIGWLDNKLHLVGGLHKNR